jgi:nucleoid-associated protein YgaU
MLKNRAGLLALAVLAIATIFIVFVALPMMRHDKGKMGDMAKQAQTAADDMAKAASGAASDTADAMKGALADGQTALLAKMDRLKADAGTAVADMQALFADGKVPTAEDIAAARAKAETALKAVSDLKLPDGMDASMMAAAKTVNDNASQWLGMVQSIPTDAEGARKAIAGLAAAMGLAVPTDMAAMGEPAKPADASAMQAAAPSFDVVRVEKDGSMVVAGRGALGSKIEIMNGETVIATSQVDKDGNFVAVLDQPLSAGDYSLVLKTTGPDGTVTVSPEVATISVPKDATGQLLAMVTKSGEASRILTAPATADTASANPATPSDTVALPNLPDAAGTIAGSAPSIAPATASPAVPDVAVAAVELEGDKIFIAGKTKPDMLVRAYADDQQVGEIKSEATGAFVVEGKIPLSVGKHVIRADVLDAAGTVVYRATVPFERPEGEDVAVVAANDGAAGAAPKMEMLGDGKFDQLRAEAAKALDLLKSLFADGKVPSAEQLAAARSSLQFALASLADFKLPDNADATATELVAKVAGSANDVLKILKDLPADAASVGAAMARIETAVNGVVSPRSNAAMAETANAAASGETAPAQDTAPEAAPAAAGTAPATQDAAANMAAQPSAEPATTQQAPLKESKTSVIIRHGDTLWEISRRVYGRGIRYTTIYLANEDQIADPDLIEPGQVFGVPDQSVPDADAEAVHRKHLQEKR